MFRKFKAILSAFLSVIMILCCIPFSHIEAEAYTEPETYEPSDIACVYIYTDQTIIKDDYVGCKIVAVDKQGGECATVSDSLAQIKIRGNSTSNGEKKPYNFKFNDKVNLFGLGKAKKWCLLANCYEKTLIRNKMVFDFADGIGMDYVADNCFVDVYLNGVLQGTYLLTEAVEIGTTRVDLDKTGGDVLFELEPYVGYSNPICFRTPKCGILLGYNDPDDPSSELISSVNVFFGKAETALLTRNQTQIEVYFDLNSFINDYIVHEFFKNVDFNTSSTRYYLKDGILYAGPVWDFDLSAGNCSSTYYTAYNNVGTTGNSWEGFNCNAQWYTILLGCTWFKNLVYARYLELQDEIVNLYQENLIGQNYIDSTIAANKASFDRNYNEAGWSIKKVFSELERIPNSTYQANVEYLRTWLKNRNLWLLSKWGLSGKYLPLNKSDGLYIIDGMFVKKVQENTYCAEFLGKFGWGARVEKDGKETGSDIVRTGDCLTCGGPSYQIAVSGDADGDRKVTVTDYISVRLDLLGINELKGAYKLAADYNGDGSVSVLDYITIRLKLLNIS
jgi:hypothetical protein